MIIAKLVPVDAQDPTYEPLVCERVTFTGSVFYGYVGSTTHYIQLPIGSTYQLVCEAKPVVSVGARTLAR